MRVSRTWKGHTGSCRAQDVSWDFPFLSKNSEVILWWKNILFLVEWSNGEWMRELEKSNASGLGWRCLSGVPNKVCIGRVLLMTNALSFPIIISHTYPTNNKNLNISKYALMISLLIKRGLSKCCQLRMPRAAQRVVSNRARRLLADSQGQDPNLTSQGVSVHLRSRQDAFDPNVTVALAKAASGLDKTQDYQLR